MPEPRRSRRTWLITGASRGIGAQLARDCVCAGDRVALVARSAAVHDVAHQLGGAAVAVQADTREPAALAALAAEVDGAFGRVDVLVNNAGVHRGGRVTKVTEEAWQEVLDTNLTGAFRVVRAVLPLLPDGAAIVNLGTVMGERGFPGDTAYASSKAGLAGFSRALAIELAPRRIRVNVVAPGFVDTAMTAALSERARDLLVSRVPLGRTATPCEVAEVVRWVASSSYMTGAVVPVDGGLSAALGSV